MDATTLELDETASADALVGRLADTVARLGAVVGDVTPTGDAARIDRIALLERVKAAAGAAQLAESVRFAQSQVVAQRDDPRFDPAKVGRGIADQLGLATKTGPWHGARKLSRARALWFDLPDTFALLTRGDISEQVAARVVTETSHHLAAGDRRSVDAQLVAVGLSDLSPQDAELRARTLTQTADPAGAAARARYARSERRVTVRPAPDTMAWPTALLPVEQAVACQAALLQARDLARAAGDPRSGGQVQADTLVERITGPTSADGVAVEVQIGMPVRNVTNPADQTPAAINGHPVPSSIAEHILHTAHRKRWRRLFVTPTGGVVGGDTRSRRFPRWLDVLIRARDQHCREPYCGAPIRHRDHIVQARHGGATRLSNTRGVCEHHNYIHELVGRQIVHDDDTIITITPPDTATAAEHPTHPEGTWMSRIVSGDEG